MSTDAPLLSDPDTLPDDPVVLKQLVVQLLEDAPLRKRLGQAAARDVRERFAWDRLANKIETAYCEELVSRNNG